MHNLTELQKCLAPCAPYGLHFYWHTEFRRKLVSLRQLIWQVEEKWVIPKVSGVVQTQTEDRA